MSECVDEILKRIQNHKGVHGIIILTPEGNAIRSTLDNSTTVQYATQITKLQNLVQSAVRDLDPSDNLEFFRIRSKKNEIMISTVKDNHTLIVIQNIL